MESLAKLYDNIPEKLKQKSGSVFYSGKSAFSGTKKVYILGLNPGGKDKDHKQYTIEKQIQEVIDQGDDSWSAYFDKNWNTGDKNTPFQNRIQKLFNALNFNASEVPASNICFVRSKDEKSIKPFLKKYVDQCWPFHQAVIETLSIQMIICLGKTTGNFVRNKLDATEYIGYYEEQNNRKWKTELYKNKEGLIVVSATHPSRADWTKANSSPIPKIVEVYNKL